MTTTEKVNGVWPTMNTVADITTPQVSEWNAPSMEQIGRTLPFVNIAESPSEYMLEVAVPGCKKEDFKIEYTNHILTISSNSEEQKVVKDSKCVYTRKEFKYNSFFRTFTLPESVDFDKIHASYKEGILCVIVTKKPVNSPKPSKAITIK